MNQEINPYRPPSSDVAVADQLHHDDEPASKGRRFGTFAVDYACYLVFAFIVGALIGLVFGQAGVAAIRKMPDFVFGVTLFFGYYVLFEGIWARTPGKWAFGTVVVNESGTRPSFGQVLGRTACRFIPFEAFSFFGSGGWHDTLSKTRVMRCR
jgi:uncharacterized RDD family membrane protein YckC